MKKLATLFTVALVLGVFVAESTALAGRPDRRQRRQGARIHQGVQSGELTKEEAGKLRAQQRKIRREKRRARADGVVTGAERARLERHQDAASQNIHEQKHDDEKR